MRESACGLSFANILSCRNIQVCGFGTNLPVEKMLIRDFFQPYYLLVVFTAAAYIIVRLVRYFTDKKADPPRGCRIEICYKGNTLTIEGFADTGNKLIDSFTGKPVIICPKSLFGYRDDDLSDPITAYEVYGLRSIPCSTVSGGGMIPVITPDSTTLLSDEKVWGHPEVLIGLAEGIDKGIFDPVILT